MSDALPDPPELDPASLSSASFTRSRKGFEPVEVRGLLERAADALRMWASRDQVMLAALADTEERAARAEDLDEDKVAELLGSETARIVTAARSAAAEIREKAEKESARLREETESAACAAADALVAEATVERDLAASARETADSQAAEIVSRATTEAERLTTEATLRADTTTSTATEEAAAMVAEAEAAAGTLRDEAQTRHDEMLAEAGSLLERRTTEADEAAATIRDAAEEAAATMRAQAEADLEAAKAEAEQLRAEALAGAARELDSARAEGREMVAEARAVRQRMLRDFAERRRSVRQQLEAARVAREGIVEAIRTAAVRLDDTLGELEEREEDVRRASDKAAESVLDDVDRVVADLEARLEQGAELDEHDASGEPPDADTPGSTHESLAPTDTGHAVVGDVGAADMDEVVRTEPTGEDEEPTDTGPAPVTTQQDASSEAVDQLASVHDLFERLRAGEVPGGDAPDGAAGAADSAAATATVTLTATEEAIDLSATELSATDPSATDLSTSAEDETARPEPVPGDASGAPSDESLLDRRDELLAPAERLLSRNLKRLVGDEQNEVLDRARRLRRGRVELTDLLPEESEAEAARHFAAALSDPFALACAAGARLWCDLTGSTPPELETAAVHDVLSTRIAELLELRSLHLRGVLEQIDESGEDLGVLVDHLRAAYRELRTTSVPELAADLANSGFNVGARAAAPQGATWRWVPDNGGLPCSDAEDNALAGALPCGAEFPTGDVLPPAHPGCRCILVPGGLG